MKLKTRGGLENKMKMKVYQTKWHLRVIGKHYFRQQTLYPCLLCLASLRPQDRGKVKRVTIPSGPNTDDGMLSNESDSERESDWSCRLYEARVGFFYICGRSSSRQQVVCGSRFEQFGHGVIVHDQPRIRFLWTRRSHKIKGRKREFKVNS